MNPGQFKHAPGSTEPILQDLKRQDLNSNDFTAEALERPPIQEVDRQNMEKELHALGKLMGSTGVWWQLDGSLNISLYRKERGEDYIGVHSDIDMSVMRSELPKLETGLKEGGYGLFLRSKNGSMRRFRRVGSATFDGRYSDGVWEAPYIAAINEHGEIRTDADLVRIQISIIDTDESGNPSERGMQYPKEWLEGKTIQFQDVNLTISHPARYLLFKIWFMRAYDDADLELFSNLHLLSKEDLDAVEKIVLATAARDDWRMNNTTFTAKIPALQQRFNHLREKLN